MKKGDKNTKFFYRTTFSHNNKNIIVSLKGSIVIEVGLGCGLEETMLDYFKKLYRLEATYLEYVIEQILEFVSPKMNQNLTVEFMTKNVKQAIFTMNSNKSLGPDGMN